MQSDKEVPDPQTSQETILVTGGSGLVGSHVIRELLQNGYNVRFTARSEETAKRIWDAHAPDKARLSSIIVPNMRIPGAHDEAVKGVDGVIHTASPFTFTPQDNVNDLLIPALQGTRGILLSIHEHNPRVSRVVLTSSIAAMMDFSIGFQRDHLYTADDWNPMTWDEAAGASGVVAYCASKGLAEKAAWDFIKEVKPNFDLVTLCPPLIWGPNLMPMKDLSSLSTSMEVLRSFFRGNLKDPGQAMFPVCVDVRDIATAHVRAYQEAAASNQRYAVCSSTFTNQQVVDIIREHFPKLEECLPGGRSEEPLAKGMDIGKAIRDLGFSSRSLDDILVDSVRSLLEIEQSVG